MTSSHSGSSLTDDQNEAEYIFDKKLKDLIRNSNTRLFERGESQQYKDKKLT